MALARALVRKSRIIISDEATSNVDVATDLKIQNAMRCNFEGRTILSIAHRIRTVLGYDVIVVMEGGKCVEVGRPGELFEREGG